jgi:hypothetical protein
MLAWPTEFLSFISYHRLRGIQLESVPSGLLMLAHLAGMPLGYVENFGAIHLVSPAADAVIPWLTPLLAAVSVAVAVVAWRRFRMEERSGGVRTESLVELLLAALLAFVVTNKVLSPQYLVWLLPFAPLLPLRKAALALGAVLLTIVIFPYNYAPLVNMRPGMILLLNARNAMLVALLLWIVLRPAVPAAISTPRAADGR